MSDSVNIAANIARAEASLQAAMQLQESSLLNDAVSRAYYSAFHTATALLRSKEKKFKSHSGVLSAIGLYFIKSGELDRNFGRELNWLAELRSIGDYGEIRDVTKEESEEAIQVAMSLLKEAKQILLSQE